MKTAKGLDQLCLCLIYLSVTFAAESISPNLNFKIKFNKCPPIKSGFRFFVEISLAECVHECFIRTNCAGVGYRRSYKLCELHSDETGHLIGSLDVDKCVFVKREDITGPSDQKIEVCDKEHSEDCTYRECPPFTLSNGKLKGNMNNIGAKKTYSCDEGFYEENGKTSSVCTTMGVWDNIPQCLRPCPQLTIENGRITVSKANIGDKAVYECYDEYTEASSRSASECLASSQWDYLPLCVKPIDLGEQCFPHWSSHNVKLCEDPVGTCISPAADGQYFCRCPSGHYDDNGSQINGGHCVPKIRLGIECPNIDGELVCLQHHADCILNSDTRICVCKSRYYDTNGANVIGGSCYSKIQNVRVCPGYSSKEVFAASCRDPLASCQRMRCKTDTHLCMCPDGYDPYRTGWCKKEEAVVETCTPESDCECFADGRQLIQYKYSEPFNIQIHSHVSTTQIAAQCACESLDGNLVKTDVLWKMDIIREILQRCPAYWHKQFWVDGKRLGNGTWVFRDENPVPMDVGTFWFDSDFGIHNDCINLDPYQGNFTMDDIHCRSNLYFICEIS